MRSDLIPPLRVRLALAMALAAALTLVTFLVTSGSAAPPNGKPLWVSALLVLPLVWAAKAGLPGGLAFALTFAFYFLASSVAVWLFTRSKPRSS